MMPHILGWKKAKKRKKRLTMSFVFVIEYIDKTSHIRVMLIENNNNDCEDRNIMITLL